MIESVKTGELVHLDLVNFFKHLLHTRDYN